MPPTRDAGTGVPAPGKESTGGASAKGCTRGRVEDEHEDGRSEERDRMPHPVARLIAAPAVPDGVAPLRLSRTQPIKKSRTRWRILASIDAGDTSAASSTYAAPRVPMSNGRRCPITIAVSSSIPRPSVRRFCVSRPAGARCCGHHEVLHLGHAKLVTSASRAPTTSCATCAHLRTPAAARRRPYRIMRYFSNSFSYF